MISSFERGSDKMQQCSIGKRLSCYLVAALCTLLSPLTLADDRSSIEAVASRLEAALGARIGIAIADTETGQRWQYRGDERFPLTSTFKPLACAAVLARADAGEEDTTRLVPVRSEDLVTYSPVTEQFVGSTITLAKACEAAITLSDNTAGNLLLDAIGGPSGLTAFLRATGDGITRLDRNEPTLNEATPGDPRDSSSPNAMVQTLERLLTGTVLSVAAARRLEQWMIDDEVADALFRSRLPTDWQIGDKTGAGGHGSRALIAVLRPRGRRPAFAAVYITETEASFTARNEAIAEIGASLFQWLQRQKSRP